MTKITPEPGSIAAVCEEASASGYTQHNQPLAEIRAAIRVDRRQAILSRPSRSRLTQEEVDASLEEANASAEQEPAAEQGPAWLEQRRRELIEQHEQEKKERQRATEARATLYLRVHRHELRLPVPTSPGVSLAGRSRESHARPRSAARRGPARSRAPSGDSDSSEPGPGPSWPGDEPFTDEEAVTVAQNVVRRCDGSLNPARFDALIFPYLFGLEGDQLGHAKLLIFLELPDRLQQSFYNAIRVGHATWAFTGAACNADRQLRFDQAGGVS